MSQPIHILIADQDCIRCAALRASTEAAGDMKVVDAAGEIKDAILKTLIFHPDVLLLDLALTKQETVQFIQRLETTVPATRVLLLAEEWTQQVRQTLLVDKPAGYLLKSASTRELLMAIRIIYHGGTVLPLALMRIPPKNAYTFTRIIHRFSPWRISSALRQIFSGSVQ